MAENPDTSLPDGEEDRDRTRFAWLPWVVLAILVLLVLWLLRGYVATPDVEPGTARSKTTTIRMQGVESPPNSEEATAAEDDAEEPSVPHVVGLSESQAADALERAGYGISVTRVHSDNKPTGKVFEQTPGAFEPAEPGTTVEVVVSSGPQPFARVTVPDMVGLSIAGAKARAEDRGLVPRLMIQPMPGSEGIVYQQSPAPGTRLEQGEKVFLLAGDSPGS